jgi:hypothetical protein
MEMKLKIYIPFSQFKIMEHVKDMRKKNQEFLMQYVTLNFNFVYSIVPT